MLDVYRGTMSLRRLRILVQYLPPESATKTAIRKSIPDEELTEATENSRPDHAPWSSLEMLTASVLDAVRLHTAVLIAVNGGSKPEIVPTSRPGIPPQSSGRKRLSNDQRRALDPRMREIPREA